MYLLLIERILLIDIGRWNLRPSQIYFTTLDSVKHISLCIEILGTISVDAAVKFANFILEELFGIIAIGYYNHVSIYICILLFNNNQNKTIIF